jgi:hypothetical protein
MKREPDRTRAKLWHLRRDHGLFLFQAKRFDGEGSGPMQLIFRFPVLTRCASRLGREIRALVESRHPLVEPKDLLGAAAMMAAAILLLNALGDPESLSGLFGVRAER